MADLFSNLPEDVDNKDMYINLSGLRAFGNVINSAKRHKGRKIGFTSQAKSNRKKVIFNIVQPSAGQTKRVSSRNPVELFKKNKKSQEIADEFAKDLLDLALSTAHKASCIVETGAATSSEKAL